MSKDFWTDFRDANHDLTRSRRNDKNSWCLIVGHDERGYTVMLQSCAGTKEVMVRVGCQYWTLPDARKHYVSKGRNWSRDSRRTARSMLALIGIAVDTAKYKGWLGRDVKFNATPRKVRR